MLPLQHRTVIHVGLHAGTRPTLVDQGRQTRKAFLEFEEDGRMKPSPYYDRIVDVMEELVKFTLLTRERADYLVDRYSERKETAEEVSARVNRK